MKFIAHRGNYAGKSSKENSPEYVIEALNAGCDVEIDVWYNNSQFYLGHDFAQYSISKQFLEQTGLWCHAKNIAAVKQLSANKNIHWFWHETDKITITNRGYIWTYPGLLVEGSVINQPTKDMLKDLDLSRFYAICSDDLSILKE